MLDTIFWVLVGLFIGWNLPQPTWAKYVQTMIMGWISKVSSMVKKASNARRIGNKRHEI